MTMPHALSLLTGIVQKLKQNILAFHDHIQTGQINHKSYYKPSLGQYFTKTPLTSNMTHFIK